MKVTYIALDPLKYPRVKKIARSLEKRSDIQFYVMIPKIQFVWHGNRMKRILSAIINYALITLQIFFVKSDIFWVANCPDILVFSLILRRKPYILEYRSPWSIEVENEFGHGPWVNLSTVVENLALTHASIVTLTTSKLMVKVKNFGKPVFVIQNYPLEAFRKVTVSREKLRRSCGCRGNEKVVLFVGKLTRVEGADLLPKVIEEVLKKIDGVVFWIVGDGPLYQTLEESVNRFFDKVKLFGWQPHEKIPNFISAADVCIAPRHKSPSSVFYNEEGLQKFSEYMFFEKPIVACGVAESSEYLLVDEDGMADGVLKALRGEVRKPRRRTWEEYSEKEIFEVFSWLRSKPFLGNKVDCIS